MPISITQAALGAEIDVPTLEKPVKQRIPEGTQTGTQFRIKGQGIPSLKNGLKGDLILTVHVEVPRKLTPKAQGARRPGRFWTQEDAEVPYGGMAGSGGAYHHLWKRPGQ